MTSEEILFSSQDIKLAGTLYMPEIIAPYPAVVVVHPASAGERTDPFYDHLKTELPEHGIAALIFDRRGSGASQGEFETADFEDLAGDVIAAVEYLQTRLDIDKRKIGLHGTSQGAWIAPIAAARSSLALSPPSQRGEGPGTTHHGSQPSATATRRRTRPTSSTSTSPTPFSTAAPPSLVCTH